MNHTYVLENSKDELKNTETSEPEVIKHFTASRLQLQTFY